VLTCAFVLIGRIAPAGTVTEAFAWVTAVFAGGNAMGSALCGAVVLSHGLVAAFSLAGGAATLGLLVCLGALTRSSLRLEATGAAEPGKGSQFGSRPEPPAPAAPIPPPPAP
jgi:hypothetical protein